MRRSIHITLAAVGGAAVGALAMWAARACLRQDGTKPGFAFHDVEPDGRHEACVRLSWDDAIAVVRDHLGSPRMSMVRHYLGEDGVEDVEIVRQSAFSPSYTMLAVMRGDRHLVWRF